MGRCILRVFPGLLLCVAVALLGWALELLEIRVAGRPLIEALVLAILVGALVRTLWEPDSRWEPGIAFTARPLLEIAIVLLGASVNVPMLLRAGPLLPLTIPLVVILALVTSYGICRALGLTRELSMLVACGNSICGNSAIAAVSPVIRARADEVAAAIAFTAVFSVVLVLLLPFMIHLAVLTHYQYGVLAGLTVYAVPQVLAATVPVSRASAEIGTLVKLLRVLLLGPVVVVLALRKGGLRDGVLSVHRLVPWFIIGFLVLATLRSLHAVPLAWIEPIRTLATILTVLAMAALGLGVDIRALRQVGARVMIGISGSLIVLIIASLLMIRWFHVVG